MRDYKLSIFKKRLYCDYFCNFSDRTKEQYSNAPWLKRLCNLYRKWCGSDNLILDLGCGVGFYSQIIKGQNNTVIGLDISEKSLKEARNKYQMATLVCDLDQKLPFKSDIFNRIFGLEVLEHLYNPQALLREIHRILKPEGEAIFSIPNAVFWRQRLLFLFGKNLNVEGLPWENIRPWFHPHIRFFSLKTAQKMFYESNFIIKEKRGTWVSFPGALSPFLPKPFNYLMSGLNLLWGGLEFMADVHPSLFSASFVFRLGKK